MNKTQQKELVKRIKNSIKSELQESDFKERAEYMGKTPEATMAWTSLKRLRTLKELSKSEAIEVLIETGMLPAEVIRKEAEAIEDW